MKRLLYISNVSGKNMSYSFAGSAIEAAKSLGLEFYTAANRSKAPLEERQADEEKYGIKLLHFDLSRSPFSLQNVKAYRQLCDIIRENKIDFIHCNTPVGGLLGRLAGKKCKVKKVIYQAHGFHFYKGAPLLNWLLYYPVEKWLARYTDVLITINQEDYELAKKTMNAKQVTYIPGVGIDVDIYHNVDVDVKAKKAELNLQDDDVVLISMGELIKRKNYEVAIKAIAKTGNKKIQYIICGRGPELESLQALAEELGVSKQVHFLGFRKDVRELLKVADVFLFTSLQEGLPRALMEAMASGLPCVVSKIRGNIDLIEDGKNGYLCLPTDVDAFTYAIQKMVQKPIFRSEAGNKNFEKVKGFDFSVAEKSISNIYAEVFAEQ